MAQPIATSKRIRTEETNFPLRAHPQEWRQRKFTIIVPINIAASATTGLGVASFVASVPFDVGSVTMEVPVIDVPASYTTTGVQASSSIAAHSITADTTDSAAWPAVTYTSGNPNIATNAGTMVTGTATCLTTVSARTEAKQTITNGDLVTTIPAGVSNQGVVGVREWASIFGVAQAIMHSQGASVSITHDFPRPVPIQGVQFTVDCYRTANADDTIGLWKDGAWGAAATYGALRLTFHRVD